MDDVKMGHIRAQLIDRRQRLERAVFEGEESSQLVGLLQEVDLALERVADGSYGLCKTCSESIEEDLLLMDPLTCFCFDHLDSSQIRELERDLELASRIQAALLPENSISTAGWEVYYYYQPAGPVSGDYCDLVTLPGEENGLLFAVGDVSGKGVAASMLMSHLHAVFHSLASFDQSVGHLMDGANRLLCESTMSTHFATLVFGKANKDGKVEVCNAGHLAPLLLHGDEIISLETTGLPAGIFCQTPYSAQSVNLNKGDSLILYTDGLSEATYGDTFYGEDRVSRLGLQHAGLSPKKLVEAYIEDLNTFTSSGAGQDDLTIMVIRRTA
jgi:sigma-B regulation protein RsbU (phosphoserine phosphatase)